MTFAPPTPAQPPRSTQSAHLPRALRPLARALDAVNRAMVALGMVALVVASLVLTSSVVTRYALKASTDWQDEAAVFCLVGATFLCSGFVQSVRGHVGIEAVAGWLSPAMNRVRLVLVDLLTTLFCVFFAWKSWSLFHEAWAEGQTTSSSWAPPLWIPYGLMAAGMSLLGLQATLQLVASVRAVGARDAATTTSDVASAATPSPATRPEASVGVVAARHDRDRDAA